MTPIKWDDFASQSDAAAFTATFNTFSLREDFSTALDDGIFDDLLIALRQLIVKSSAESALPMIQGRELDLSSFDRADFFSGDQFYPTQFAIRDGDQGIKDVALLHYARNLLMDDSVDFTEIIRSGNYVKIEDAKNAFHKNGVGNQNNTKWMSQDKTQEYIVRESAAGFEIVTDERNLGTYNFSSSLVLGLSHFDLDVDPWIVFGNLPGDSTTFAERQAGTGILIGGIPLAASAISSALNVVKSSFGSYESFGDENDTIIVPFDQDWSVLAGNGDDIIFSGNKVDWIDGGAGVDAVHYGGSSSGVAVNLTTGFGYMGYASEDDTLEQLFSIENVSGSEFSDVLIGDEGSNMLSGLEGVDILEGAGGADILDGGFGNDKLDGGEGIDIALYEGASSDYEIGWIDSERTELQVRTLATGGAGIDVLRGIETLRFSGGIDLNLDEVQNFVVPVVTSLEAGREMVAEAIERLNSESSIFFDLLGRLAKASDNAIELAGDVIEGDVRILHRGGTIVVSDLLLDDIPTLLETLNQSIDSFKRLKDTIDNPDNGGDHVVDLTLALASGKLGAWAGASIVALAPVSVPALAVVSVAAVVGVSVTWVANEYGDQIAEYLRLDEIVQAGAEGIGEAAGWIIERANDGIEWASDAARDAAQSAVTSLGGAYFDIVYRGDDTFDVRTSSDSNGTFRGGPGFDHLTFTHDRFVSSGNRGLAGIERGLQVEGVTVSSSSSAVETMLSDQSSSDGVITYFVLSGTRVVSTITGSTTYPVYSTISVSPDIERFDVTGFTADDAILVTNGLLYDGGAGNDLLIADYSNRTTALNLDLDPTITQTLYDGVTIENFERLHLRLGSGDDHITSGSLNDHLYGGAGNDVLIGAEGNNTLIGDAGNDTLTGDGTLSGGEGDDVLTGRGTLTGGAGIDTLTGSGTLDGGDGADTITATSGATITGGLGEDTIDIVTGNTSVSGGDGFDHLTFTHDRFVSSGNRGLAGIERGLQVEGVTVSSSSSAVETMLSDQSSSDGVITYFVLSGTRVVSTITGSTTYPVYSTISVSPDIERFDVTGFTADDAILVTNGLLYDGGAGNDLLIADYSNRTTALNLDLDPTITQTLYDGVTIENFERLHLRLGSGDDHITSGSLNDHLYGGAGNDVLIGAEGNNTLIGDAGNDTLTGDGTLSGGEGDDVLTGRGTLTGGAGIDTLTGSGTLDGGDGADTITATSGATITGGLGEDTIDIVTGNTSVSGGDGFDHLTFTHDRFVSSGNRGLAGIERGLQVEGVTVSSSSSAVETMLSDQSSSDGVITYFVLSGTRVVSTITGSTTYPVYSTISVSPDIERFDVTGFTADDAILVTNGLLYDGGAGNDLLIADYSNRTTALNLDLDPTITQTLYDGVTIENFERLHLRLGSGDDHITSGSLNDHLYGGAGNDVLIGAEGNNTLIGDAGNDTLTGDGTLSGGEGDDVLTGRGTLTGGAGIDTLTGSGTLDGGDGADTITATSGATITGGLGEDTIDIVTGNTSVSGGDGFDHLTFTHDRFVSSGNRGLAGIERGLQVEGVTVSSSSSAVETMLSDQSSSDGVITYFVLSGTRVVSTITGSTTYPVYSTISVSPDIERFDVTGFTADDAILVTNGLLYDGGAGNDLLIADYSNRTTALNLDLDPTITQTLYDGVTIENFERLHLRLGSGDDHITSGSLNDHLYGGAGNDVLIGAEGNNTLIGDAGNDTLTGDGTLSGGEGDDVLTGRGTLTGGAGIDTLTGSGTLDGGDGADTITATSGATITGGLGEDTIDIVTGNTSVSGGDGFDHLTFTHDRFVSSGNRGLAGIERGLQVEGVTVSSSSSAVETMLSDQSSSDGVITYFVLSGTRVVSTITGSTTYPVYSTISVSPDIERFDVTGFTADDAILVTNGLLYDGGAGNDLLIADYSNRTTALNLDLDPTITQTLYDGVTIENFERLHLRLGSGDDHITSGSLNDHLYGGAGNDVLIGAEGNNTLIGDAGNDTLTGDGTLSGGEGDDVLTGRGTLTGGAGIDTLTGSGTLDGGDGADTITATSGATITGGLGEDTIDIVTGNTSVSGGDGFDHLTFTHDRFVSSGNRGLAGIERGLQVEGVTVSSSSSAVETMLSDQSSSDGVITYFVLSGTRVVSTITGSTTYPVYSTISVSPDIERFDVTGFTADDAILVTNGLLYDGGAGNDLLIADYSNRTTALNLDLDPTITQTLYDGVTIENFERLHLRLGSGDDHITSGSLNDHLYGGAGDDNLAGGVGADTLDGGEGIDWVQYVGSTAGVTVDLNADAVTGLQSAFGGDAQGDVISGFERVNGSDHTDTLTGNDEANYLIGRDGDDVINAGAGNDIVRGGVGADTLDGGEGIDWVQYVGSTAGVTVDLNADAVTGLQSAFGGDAQGDVISGFERVNGSDHTDTLTGNDEANYLIGRDGDDVINAGAGNDHVRGGVGADTLDGGEGIDWVQYVGSTAGVTVDLNADAVTGLQSAFGGDAQGDVISGFERVYGSDHTDTLTGNDEANYLIGRDGDDVINAGAGNDHVRGGVGADTLDGGEGIDWVQYVGSTAGVTVDLNADAVTGLQSAFGGDAQGDVISGFERVYGSDHTDTLTGNDEANYLIGRDGDDVINAGAGNDIVRGGVGADTLDGGEGIDWVQYVGSTAGVTVDLNADAVTGLQSAFGGDAQGDVISGFERVNGSDHTDTLTGNDEANYLIGRDGDDVINAGAGNDIVRGGVGADTLDGGEGIDWVQYVGSTAGVTVDLNADAVTGLQSAFGGDAQGDVISGFERVNGSDHTDTLTGNDEANYLIGRDGDDVINAGAGNDHVRGGVGADTLDGGEGIDWVQYVGSTAGVTVDLNADAVTGLQSAFGGDAQGDVISGFERVYGSDHTDTLTGNDEANYLIGRDGDDVINAGAGNDTIRGGAGADLFVFSVLDGGDTILDFELGIDQINFADLSFGDLEFSSRGNGIQIGYGFSDTVYLSGIGNVTLTDDDFVFV